MTQYVHEKVQVMERPVTVWVFLAIAFMLVVTYGYFVNSAIVNIVSAKSMQARVAELTSSVGDLEARYLSAKSALSMEDAHALGFGDSTKVQITYIAKAAQPFSFNR